MIVSMEGGGLLHSATTFDRCVFAARAIAASMKVLAVRVTASAQIGGNIRVEETNNVFRHIRALTPLHSAS